MRIVVDDLSGPEIAEFLDEHVRQMRSITPLESKHALDLDALREPDVTFWSVMDGGAVVGCGAIKRLDASLPPAAAMARQTRRLAAALSRSRVGRWPSLIGRPPPVARA